MVWLVVVLVWMTVVGRGWGAAERGVEGKVGGAFGAEVAAGRERGTVGLRAVRSVGCGVQC